MHDSLRVDDRDFIRRVRKLGRRTGTSVAVDSAHGKGSHQRLYYGERFTTVRRGEIPKGILRAMCKQLGIDPGEL